MRSVHFGIDFSAYFREEIRELQTLAADGLVRIAHERITATSAGRLLLRNIAMCFDRYLAAPSPAAQAVPRSRAV